MAKPHSFNIRQAQHSPRQHGHRVCVVEEPRVRADLFHVPGKVEHHGNRPQGPKDSSYPQCIRNGLFQAVFLRNLKIRNRTGIIAADLNRIDCVFCAAKRIFTGFHSQILMNHCLGAAVPVYRFKHHGRLIKTLGIDVIESDLNPLQGRSHHAVPQHIFRKYSRSGS